jgi:hypothetical protein
MELKARPAKQGTSAYFLKSLVLDLLGGNPAKTDETDSPAVVVISSSGKERVIQHTGTYHQAQAACRRFEAERQKLGDLEFCRLHGLPERFAQ